ncbi:MAG TPA: class I mannose-6-phosphate isomerase [Bryobacteraceae bacterium]|nr:class I mannose-6-phosphate isomerase [Bryobacteraceae bacterium]
MTNYDLAPSVEVSAEAGACLEGWQEIGARLRAEAGRGAGLIAVECYPGVFVGEVERALTEALRPAAILHAAEALKAREEIEQIACPLLTDDPVFGRMNDLTLEDLFDAGRLEGMRRRAGERHEGVTLVIGTGAALTAPHADVLVYADLARWEIQGRQRKHQVANLGVANLADRPGALYKRAFFLDWRVCDRLKRQLLDPIDFLLDTNQRETPRMITGADFREGLDRAARRPFRVVPFFDPGPWGGTWMMDTFGLPRNQPNYAWCFDCVPEENSLLLGFGARRVEIPAIDLVFYRPQELLGDFVYRRFGAEFPIRFDLLDTLNGGNLSLQVHPLTSYIREKFGMSYTQDESYYMLDAAPDASVYLGLKTGIDRARMAADLRLAQGGGASFPAEQYVNRWPASKHDHFLIPGGTIHCSGRNSVVLEISATPYIFTFKLWDWERLGLDGRPRPIHLDHGLENIQWDRTTDWVKHNLVNRVEPLGAADGWREERTGLHELEFIETRRHWFSGPVTHECGGSVNVLNLVEGREATVESCDGAFEPFVVHYAETFIVPAAVGRYTIRPTGAARGKECATIKASVRNGYAG